MEMEETVEVVEEVQMRSRKAMTVMTRMKAATFPGGGDGPAETVMTAQVIVLIQVDIAAVQDESEACTTCTGYESSVVLYSEKKLNVVLLV